MTFLRIQKTRRIYLRGLVLALLVPLTTSACATSRVGEVEIRQEGGMPCFTITPNEEHRAGGVPHLAALGVYDASVKPVIEVWAFNLSAEKSQPISSSTCVRYGQAPSESESTKAVPLQTGRVYEIFLKTKRVEPTDPTFGHEAKFCLVAKPDGGVRVHQVIYNKGWRYEMCGK